METSSSNVAAVPDMRLDMSELDSYMKKEPTRVFFERGQKGQLEATYEPVDPVSIKSGNDFQVSVDTCAVHPGWYWAVFCVSLGELDESKLKSITFDVTSENMCLGIVYTKDYTCKTVIQRDEIDLLPKTKFARLRLHRQIEVSPGITPSVSIKVEKALGWEEAVMPFDLHYFELAYHDIRSEDHILWGEGKPDQFISMGDDAACGTWPIAIEAYDFSPTGKLAVTAYFTRGSDTHVPDRTPNSTHDRSQNPESFHDLDRDHSHISSSIYTETVAHIDVWDLSVPSGQVVSDNPQAITTPLKRLSIPMRILKKPPGDSREKKSPDDERPPNHPPAPPLPTINISSTGFHIIMAVGWETRQEHATPFIIYRAEQNPPVTYDYKQIPNTCQSIQKYYGYGTFHHTDKINPKAEDERYFNFHGSNFDVYSTNGGWKQLYSRSFGIYGFLRRPEDMFYLYQSLRGRYFAWTGDRGTVSIWDFETGKFVTTILVPKDKRGVCAALSEDGSMVAITVNGRIQVHDVVSGIELGSHKAEWIQDNRTEIIFRQDYFMALDAEKSTSGKKNIDAPSIFRLRDMKIVKTHFVHWEYSAEFSSIVNPMFSFKQGAILNIKRLGNILCPTEDNGCAPDVSCDFQVTELDLEDKTWSSKNQPSAETSFFAGPDYSPSDRSNIMRLSITNNYNNTSLSLGPENSNSFGFFVAASSQIVLILNGLLQVWRLPSEADKEYELVHIEAFVVVSKSHPNDICQTKVSSVQSCIHGRKFMIKIEPIQWLPDPKKKEIEDGPEQQDYKDGSERKQANDDSGDEEEEHPESNQSRTLTFPRTADDTFPASDKYRYEKGVASLLDTYANSEASIRDAITRFLVDRIRSSSKYGSSLVILCRSWTCGNGMIFEELIAKLLPDGERHTWIPDINATKKEDPIAIFLKTAEIWPGVLGACKIIMNYCVNHAIGSQNISFLSPVFRNLRSIMVHFPDETQVLLSKIAYISVGYRWRDYVIENSIVISSAWRFLLSRKTPLRLNEIKKPIMQLHVTMGTGGSHTKADTFNRPIYVAAFDALWHFEDISECESENSEERAVKHESVTSQWLTQEVKISIDPDGPTLQRAAIPQKTTWWKTLYYMFRHKLQLTPHNYVTCHAYSLEFFDNPAIAALVDYKWNTIGYPYWAVRFSFQCLFYGLVIAAALMQIYHENVRRSQLVGVFVTIIIVGAVFLWFELLLALSHLFRHKRVPYNLLDITAYALPIVASFTTLMAFNNNYSMANTRILSYSVLFVLIHMLFELRVFKSVCQYETFIRQSVVEIRVFFLIFAGGIVAFTISTLHLLRACLVPGLCEDSATKFSKDFLGALSATYFFVGGRFEPVSEELDSKDWGFHLMMIVYFFFTVVVMLNVLIALINVAFTKRDDSLRLIQARLHYVELAENLSYHIPGFRQTHNWFPKEIYFCATAQEVEEYKQAVRASEGEDKDSLENDAAIKELKAFAQNLERQLISQQEREERRFEELKDLLFGRAKYKKID